MKRISIKRKVDGKVTHGPRMMEDPTEWLAKHNVPGSPWGDLGSYDVIIEDVTQELADADTKLSKEKSAKVKRITQIKTVLDNFDSMSNLEKADIIKKILKYILINEKQLNEDISQEG